MREQGQGQVTKKPVSILIVDSDDKERYDLVAQLTQVSSTCVFHHAATGKTALEFLASHCVDCVLLELDLKDMSGFEVLNSLVPCPSKPRIAVVVRTRLTHPSLLTVARQNGAQAAFVRNGTPPEMVHAAIAEAIAAVPGPEKAPVLRSVRFGRKSLNAMTSP
jgi:CheY-like chemotaxis protein